VDLLAGRRAPTRPVTVAPLEVVPRGSTEMVAVDDRDMKRAVLFIRSHAAESIDVGDLLKAVPISRRSLEAKFRRHFNRTPSEEIRRLRLEKARHLLSHTALPMAEVARQSGFSSARYLAMAFRREVGTSPQAYRRRSAGALMK
jgi:LacI family transcriptional regulator